MILDSTGSVKGYMALMLFYFFKGISVSPGRVQRWDFSHYLSLMANWSAHIVDADERFQAGIVRTY